MRTPRAPKTRSECLPSGSLHKRPCPYVRCKYHLLWSINKSQFGCFKYLSNDQLVDILFTMKETCCLDVIDNIDTHGEYTLEEIGEFVGMSRERIRQMVDYNKPIGKQKDKRIRHGAIQKMRHYTRKKLLQPFIDGYDRQGRVVIET